MNDECLREKKEEEENEIIIEKNFLYLNTLLYDEKKYPIQMTKWRLKQHIKTIACALVSCLNIGVDPPDIKKTNPCGRMECWVEPDRESPQKSLERIGKALQFQYEQWHPKAQFKLCMDPTVEEIKKLCIALRKVAKEDRVLLHYNGHGVPRPTKNGEIWVFNKNYTQYIPLSIYELQTWLGNPCICIFDSSAAGTIIEWFETFSAQRKAEDDKTPELLPTDRILFAACDKNQILPMNPNLPADIFTSCLTTPIQMAFRWFCNTSVLSDKELNLDIQNLIIPGSVNDRKSPLGELNWIFTSITDTIAWNTLPSDLFQKLFRQDLLVAALCRNFLLAERIMRSLKCTPVSYPKFPLTHQHPLWQAWDLAIDGCVSQLIDMEENVHNYQPLPFFKDQLRAFELWMEYAGPQKKKPPEQLPIVLQMLLNQTFRLEALQLLAKFVNLGAWAVNELLSIGIFPYVLKLLQTPNVNQPLEGLQLEMRPSILLIWAKILCLDKSCQADLIKEKGHLYFLNVLAHPKLTPPFQRALAALCLSIIVSNFKTAQRVCLNANLLNTCFSQLDEPDPFLRKWLLLCIGKVWEDFEEAKWNESNQTWNDLVCKQLKDSSPEVRSAAVYALGTFFTLENTELKIHSDLNSALPLLTVAGDPSIYVRKAVLISLGRRISCFENEFRDAAYLIRIEQQADLERRKKEEILAIQEQTLDLVSHVGWFGLDTRKKKKDGTKYIKLKDSKSKAPISRSRGERQNIFITLWKVVLNLSMDPIPEISNLATLIVNTLSTQSGTLTHSTSFDGSIDPLIEEQDPQKKKGVFSDTLRKVGVLGKEKVPSHRRTASEDMPTSKEIEDIQNNRSLEDNSIRKIDRRNAIPSLLQSLVGTDSENFFEWNRRAFLNSMQAKQIKKSLFFQKQRREKTMNAVKIKATVLLKELELKRHQDENNIPAEFLTFGPVDNPTHVLLHSFDPAIVVAEAKNIVSVWNLETHQKICSFNNLTSRNVPNFQQEVSTSGMVFLNETETSLLLVGSSDGIVRIWSGYQQEAKLIAGWRSIFSPELEPLQMHWQNATKKLFTTGKLDSINMWDLNQEQLVRDISVGRHAKENSNQSLQSDTFITCFSKDSLDTRILVAGCADGSIRLYDPRLPEALVNIYKEHRNSVLSVNVPLFESNRIVSASISGTIKIWDATSGRSIKSWNNHLPIKEPLSAGNVAVHRYAPIIAIASPKFKSYRLFDFNGNDLNLIKTEIKTSSSTCLAFHPYSFLLTSTLSDSIHQISFEL